MTELIKVCPKCKSERPVGEFVCRGEIEGKPCQWPLASVVPTPPGSPAGDATTPDNNSGPAPEPRRCSNGHEISQGDAICPTCSEPLHDGFIEIDGWQVVRQIDSVESVQECYLAEHRETKRQAVLSLYCENAEPDPEVYETLQKIDVDHVPEIISFGHRNGRPYEITEYISGGDLVGLEIDPDDKETLRTIVDEIGRALDDFTRMGLRHRNLKPEVILIRDPEKLDLVITGFGSARMSEFDLDLVSTLETTRYMAPEAVLGAVAPASDWWSLGMILLEKLTNGACFAGVNDQVFHIHVSTHGVPLPDDLDDDVTLLLRGLLAFNSKDRWQWREVKAWLDGKPVDAPTNARAPAQEEKGPAIELGERTYRRLSDYALAAAESANWDDAKNQLLRGRLIGWARDVGLPSKSLSLLRSIAKRELDEDVQLAIALKVLNPDLPFVIRGEIVNAGWLIKNAEVGYRLITSEAPEILLGLDSDKWGWLARLHRRAKAVRARAAHHDIDLIEEDLQVFLLSTSRANLAAEWERRRALHPDTEHSGLAAIMNRRQVADEDLIILASANHEQFRTLDEIIDKAGEIARKSGVRSFDPDAARAIIQEHRRRKVFELVGNRIVDFAHCGIDDVDKWADTFRHEHHMPLARALVLLSIPQDHWEKPADQAYVAQLISFFEQKIALSIKRGALARMTMGRTSKKIDLMELGTKRRPAPQLLDRIVDRSERRSELDPAIFADDPDLEARLRGLHQQAMLYKRDTGIDGLYIGFPFLVFQPIGATALPRIAPVLLWPVRLEARVGRRGAYGISFDAEREEVRLNPALEGFLGTEEVEKWQQAGERLLGHATRAGDVIDEFGYLAAVRQDKLVRLPGGDAKLSPGQGEIVCSAVLFHVAFMAQAVLEDLRRLKQTSPHDTALATMLRLSTDTEAIEPEDEPREVERYFTMDSDPSQEAAVLSARKGPGLLIEGPPGTGKSQTIVNIVSDAIGRRKSLLLVCQKHAALKVVRKRLEAEGLGNRIVMVGDVNTDRRIIVRSIREQVEAIFDNESVGRLVASERERFGRQIEVLERKLDAHHAAVHRSDPACGRSYRQVIGELVALESTGRKPINCLPIRGVLADMGMDKLSEIEETCAPLARDWLAARYENSPLASLDRFAWDDATLAAFAEDFDQFRRVEGNREALLAMEPPPFNVRELSDTELAGWRDRARIATAGVSFLGRLGLRRFFARRRLRGLLIAQLGEASEEAMHNYRGSIDVERGRRAALMKQSDESLRALDRLKRWFVGDWIASADEVIRKAKSNRSVLEAIQEARPTLAAYQLFRAKTQNLPGEAWEVFSALSSVAGQLKKRARNKLEDDIRCIVKREARLAWKARMEGAATELLDDHGQIASTIEALAEADREMRRLNRLLLARGASSHSLGSRREWEDITRLTGPRMKSLRQFVKAGASLGLFELRPIWLMNPDTASRLFSLDRAFFDIVVYDEASQMPVEHALPTLFRARTVIVSGDEKQLPPTSFFARRAETDEAELYDGAEPGEDAGEAEVDAAVEIWNRREIKDCTDLLTLARPVLTNTMLEVHYRSTYRELIGFSNAAFYAGRLNVPARHPDDVIRRAKPIEVVRVDGQYESQTNEAEAERVVKLVAKFWHKRGRPSVGVVTFNRKQADLIEEHLEKRAQEDERFRTAYARELSRTEDGEDKGFFVKNVENVQGDERDVIIFSTTFGRNAEGTFRRFFGVLGQKGGERRLNVAISRAREKVVLVTSMPVSDVSDMLLSARPPSSPRDYLQGYLHYAERLSKGDFGSARGMLRQLLGKPVGREPAVHKTGDRFAETIAAHVRGLGYEIEPALDGTAFGLDFAIRDPQSGLFAIGIECDAPMHPLLARARSREIWRPSVLAKSIPTVHRVSSHGWYHAREEEKERLAEAIARATGQQTMEQIA